MREKAIDWYGLNTTKEFRKWEFVVEYLGELMNYKEAKEREKYAEDPSIGPYMYYFECQGKKWCMDGTDTGASGCLINHSKSNPNLKPRAMTVDDDLASCSSP